MKLLFVLLAAICFYSPVFAQGEDAENCKDHPLFNRLPNFRILECNANFASLEVMFASDKKQEQEGNRTHIKYTLHNPDNKLKPPSWLQVKKNYENAITKAGGKKIYSDDAFATYKLTNGGKETYVQLQMASGEELAVEEFWLDILEKEEMKQEIEASAMFKEISEKGFIALYINFETGKSTIKSESMPVVAQMVQMLKEAPQLKISIEGHTDNTGNAAANQTLSEQRAAALVKALADKGIDKSRLSSKGWGQTKPVADNATNEGKAKNRRVEIVKI